MDYYFLQFKLIISFHSIESLLLNVILKLKRLRLLILFKIVFSWRKAFLCFHFILDIFSQPKKTKPVKKTTTQLKKTSVLSIFDENAPSIFDDPLNALGGD